MKTVISQLKEQVLPQKKLKERLWKCVHEYMYVYACANA